jgi:hypothetical protein
MRGAGYGWIIDKDRLSNGEGSRVGIMGPHNLIDSIKAQLESGKGEPFRLLDDDGEIYYEGRIIHHEGYEAPDTGFEPLDDFGEPDAGCSGIQYKSERTGQWEDL